VNLKFQTDRHTDAMGIDIAAAGITFRLFEEAG
jgi:hypothetical protein